MSKITMSAKGKGAAHVIADAVSESKTSLELEATIKCAADVACAVEALDALTSAQQDEVDALFSYRSDVREHLPGIDPPVANLRRARDAVDEALSAAKERCWSAWAIVVELKSDSAHHESDDIVRAFVARVAD